MASTEFPASLAAYEAGLAAAFADALVVDDIEAKHRKMRQSAYLFLRATCFRWAEMADELCPDLAGEAVVASVGDAHAGNFGLWRDGRARLVWGVNDYDEAARLPWPFDLVRLAASLLVARDDWVADDVTEMLCDGYERGLEMPLPLILERRRLWLRDAFMATDAERLALWEALEEAPPAEPRPPGLREPLVAALGEATAVHVCRRIAGTGSLGRPRFAAIGVWQGGPVAAEVKGALPTCFTGRGDAGLAQALAHGRHRAGEPGLHYAADFVVRRLAPDNRKLDFDQVKARLGGRLMRAMGADLAAVHAQQADVGPLRRALTRGARRRLSEAAGRVAQWTQDEWRAYRDRS